MRFDVRADWGINAFCNFDCRYCFLHTRRKRDPAFKGQDPDRIIEGFNRTGLTWHINASGGEPFFQPEFVRVCRELTRRHYLSLITNLSTANVRRFAEEVDPGRVEHVFCSLHIEERRRLGLVEDFTQKYHLLRQRGFPAFVSQVMYPPLLKDFGRLFESFRERGVIVRPKAFRGYWNLRLYPAAYSASQRQTLAHYHTLARELGGEGGPTAPQRLDRGRLSFTGLPCTAGRDFVVIDYSGDVLRCHGDRQRLGNIFEGGVKLLGEAGPCPVRVCPCPAHGLHHARGEPRVLTDTEPWRRRLSHAWRQVKRRLRGR